MKGTIFDIKNTEIQTNSLVYNYDFVILKCSIRKTLENRTNMEDDRISLLETQLAQARLIAEESDKKYEEVRSGLRVEVVGFWIIQ